MGKFCFLISILFFFNKNMVAQSRKLEVEQGETKNISPQLYNYDTVHIKKGGTLKINDNGSNWLVLNAKVIICDGIIEYRNFKRGIGTVTFALSNGEVIKHTFYEHMGGAGGNGSGNGYKLGGIGYKPNDHNGGGGGSGAYYTGSPSVNIEGVSATDFRGASSPNGSGAGGDGARQTYGHGGVICLIADKIIFGNSAKINLKGSDGIQGKDGYIGACYGGGTGYYFGGGGGGGGTSGGNGGVFIVKCYNVVNTPTIDVNSGKGGAGGRGGRGGGQCPYHGMSGNPGDDGESGYTNL